MKVYCTVALCLLLTFITLLPKVVCGQINLSSHYVDDRINSDNYLKFKKDGGFEYRYRYDLMHDFATGSYKFSHDTVYLKYNTTSEKIDSTELIYRDERRRADTLIVKSHRLYKVKDGESEEFAPKIVAEHKVPKSWKYKRRYLLFGPYQSTRAGRYYMIDSAYASWNKYKKTKD